MLHTLHLTQMMGSSSVSVDTLLDCQRLWNTLYIKNMINIISGYNLKIVHLGSVSLFCIQNSRNPARPQYYYIFIVLLSYATYIVNYSFPKELVNRKKLGGATSSDFSLVSPYFTSSISFRKFICILRVFMLCLKLN